jgi:hypothetical protein
MLAAASIMAAGSLIGFSRAGTAWAASYSHLCSYDIAGYGADLLGPPNEFCPDSDSGISNPVDLQTPSQPALTNWTYPNTVGAEAAIRQADNVNFCMQLDESFPDSAGGYYVVGASCVGDLAEDWINVYNSAYGRTIFESAYNSGLCLAVPVSGGEITTVLGTVPCGDDNSSTPWNELWGIPPS